MEHLDRAISALEGALETASDVGVMGSLTEIGRNTMRFGVIHQFEFTYESCRLFIERWLLENYGREVAGVSRRDMYRIAGEIGFIDGVERWFSYHEERNRTSHRYDEELLKMLDGTVPRFVEDAKALLSILRARND